MSDVEPISVIEVVADGPNEVTVEEIRNTVTVVEESPNQVFVSTVGLQGPPGPPGDEGPAGEGVPVGGNTDQLLAKASDDDYDTTWTSSVRIESVTLADGSAAYATDLITATTSSTQANQILDVAEGQSVKYLIRASDGVSAQTTEILASVCSGNVYFVEYGTIAVNGTLASFDVTNPEAGVTLSVTPTTGTLITYRVVKHVISG
jgi:hypothetical protein